MGPLLFSLYMLPLALIFQKYNISYHCYADDSQLYLPVRLDTTASFDVLLECVDDIKRWMTNNFLQLNEDKTEVLILGCPADSSPALKAQLGPLSKNVCKQIKNLGVIFDSSLFFDKQISAVIRGSFFHLRSIAKLKNILSSKDLEVAIHAFVTSRLDYCNSLYCGLPQSSLSRLQIVQNAAARLLTGSRKRDHISPVLASLHWLPIKFRVDFKILMFVYKALSGCAPKYICDLIVPYCPARSLRSSNHLLLKVSRSRYKLKGDRAFSVAGPKLWNALPYHVRSAPSLDIFKSTLKTHFYSLAFGNL